MVSSATFNAGVESMRRDLSWCTDVLEVISGVGGEMWGLSRGADEVGLFSCGVREMG